MPEPNPTTSTGVLDWVVVPSPSQPVPQHLTAPPVVTAHECWSPAETVAPPEPNPTTPTGVVDGLLVPSPSSPWMLCPQHLAAPLVAAAHKWLYE